VTPELIKRELANLDPSDPLRRPGLHVDVTPVPEGSECDQQVYLELKMYADRGRRVVTETADHDLLRYWREAPGSFVIYCASPSQAMLLEHAPGSVGHLANLKKAQDFHAKLANKAHAALTKATSKFEGAQKAATDLRAALKTATAEQARHTRDQLDPLAAQRATYLKEVELKQRTKCSETVRWWSFVMLFGE
jgi:hypothetical protein